MLSILELPTVRHLASPLSVEEYHHLGEFNENGRRTELIRGVVIEKMSKSPQHVFLLARLYERVRRAVSPDLHVRSQEPLTFTDSEPEPDVAVVTGTLEDYASAHPTTALLAIEIAVTSEELDRAKADLYAEADIPEYWLVLVARRAVEVHTLPRVGSYTRRQLFGPGETLTCGALPALSLPLDTLFAG